MENGMKSQDKGDFLCKKVSVYHYLTWNMPSDKTIHWPLHYIIDKIGFEMIK